MGRLDVGGSQRNEKTALAMLAGQNGNVPFLTLSSPFPSGPRSAPHSLTKSSDSGGSPSLRNQRFFSASRKRLILSPILPKTTKFEMTLAQLAILFAFLCLECSTFYIDRAKMPTSRCRLSLSASEPFEEPMEEATLDDFDYATVNKVKKEVLVTYSSRLCLI